MWTEAHRARHDACLKEIVSLHAVAEVARWLERADPPRSGRATPYGAVVRAIAWHLCIGGPWRALPPGGPHWRAVYGWFRKWLEQGLFDRLLGDVARRRRRAMGRRAKPRARCPGDPRWSGQAGRCASPPLRRRGAET